jgi:hypothetical protein
VWGMGERWSLMGRLISRSGWSSEISMFKRFQTAARFDNCCFIRRRLELGKPVRRSWIV